MQPLWLYVMNQRGVNLTMNRTVRGVTLVELMVVVAISAILAGIWAKQLTARRVKQMHTEKVMAAFVMLQRPKIAVTEHFMYEGEFPIDNQDADLPASEVLAGIETESIEVQYGAIHITLKKGGPESPNKVLSVRPAVLKAEPRGPYITWVCGNQDADTRLFVFGRNRTNVDNQYLPRQCRGNGIGTGIEAVNAENYAEEVVINE